MRTPMILALLLCTAFAHAGEQKRELPPFTSISSKGAMNMVVQVGQAQSVLVTGDDKFIGKVAMKVVGNELFITTENEKNVHLKSDSKIIVTLPALKAFRVEGAGLAELNNISGDRMDIEFQGAGRLVANGKVKLLKMTAEGVGEVDTKALLAQHANVNFEGIGRVKVYASERLDAVVQGMGSLNYYGNPKTVNKTVEGIGSVKAGG
jgi:hypothetical protein